jgi:hypothetical protein
MFPKNILLGASSAACLRLLELFQCLFRSNLSSILYLPSTVLLAPQNSTGILGLHKESLANIVLCLVQISWDANKFATCCVVPSFYLHLLIDIVFMIQLHQLFVTHIHITIWHYFCVHCEQENITILWVNLEFLAFPLYSTISTISTRN